MHPTSEMMSKCRKWHLREPKFAKFHGGACPQTPLEARASGAKKYLPKHKRTPLNRIHPTGLILVLKSSSEQIFSRKLPLGAPVDSASKKKSCSYFNFLSLPLSIFPVLFLCTSYKRKKTYKELKALDSGVTVKYINSWL